jgi:VanZ family protein
VAAAFALEAAQRWAPTRDPSLHDALVKALGAVIGVAMAWGADAAFLRWRAARNRSDGPA